MIILNQYRDIWMAQKYDEVIGFYPREFYPLENVENEFIKNAQIYGDKYGVV